MKKNKKIDLSKVDEKDIISFGEWTVPEKWEDITLGQYQEIERIYRPPMEEGETVINERQ